MTTPNTDAMKPADPQPTTAQTAPAPAPAASALPARAPERESRIAVRMGVAPQNVDEAWRLSQYLANSDLVPKHFRRQPGDVLVAMQLGMELGLAPMQALQSVAVINGRASVWGDALLALVIASPLYQDHDEYFEVGGQRRDGLVGDDWKADTTCAVCLVKRHNKATPVVARFSVAQAKKAQLLGKEGPWQTYPDRMLRMRARGFALRDAFPDLLRGIKTAEEVYDDPEDVTPLRDGREVRRVSDTRPELRGFDVDRTAATRHEDLITIGPVGIVAVEPLVGGAWAIRCSDGTVVDTAEQSDAVDLDKVAGSAHKYQLFCVRLPGGDGSGALVLRRFVNAD